MDTKNLILEREALGFPWPCLDPFLFCAWHNDRYPEGNEALGPEADLRGRDMGQDFAFKDGWNMYHGRVVPGFPRHPHRGFETVTVVRRGYIDHSDSLGATARYGQGDAQWLTTGRGISHSEMLPLLKRDAANPVELFQIWLNLPAARKMAAPAFKILWAEEQPVLKGKGSSLTLIAGSLDGKTPPAPPPDSYASEPASDVLIAVLQAEAGGSFTLPAAPSGVNRRLYLHQGAWLLNSTPAQPGQAVTIRADSEANLFSPEGGELLILQGRPLNEPVASHGPFVLNTREQLIKAFDDYEKTEFGGWPWDSIDPVHPRDAGRFARRADGSVERR